MKKWDRVSFVGLIILFFGVSCADSEELIIPFIVMALGVSILAFGSWMSGGFN